MGYVARMRVINTFSVSVENPEGKILLKRLRHMEGYNIKIDYRDVGCENVE
jgi:hypothetical protein